MDDLEAFFKVTEAIRKNTALTQIKFFSLTLFPQPGGHWICSTDQLACPIGLNRCECKMATTPSKCKRKKGEMWGHSLHSLMKDSLELGVTCRSQDCSLDLRCVYCVSWSVDKWSRVQAYIDELQRQCERK